jgi:hypothetical protein
VQTNGKIVVSGDFTKLNGEPRSEFAGTSAHQLHPRFHNSKQFLSVSCASGKHSVELISITTSSAPSELIASGSLW